MAKNYYITQKLNLNGKATSTSFSIYADEADIVAMVAGLEGAVEVKEVNESISVDTGADTLVTVSNPVTNIGLVGTQNQYVSIRPYSGSIHFKNTFSVDDIAEVCKLMKPFPLLPTETPSRVNVKSSETR